MFAAAFKLAAQFTKPVFHAAQHFDQSVSVGNGSLVVINDEGWFFTAAHVLNFIAAFQNDSKFAIEHQAEVQRINSDPHSKKSFKDKQLNKLKSNPKWVVGFAYWWAPGPASQPLAFDTDELIVLPEHDIAIGRLRNFDSAMSSAYPVFKDPVDLTPGTGLCKVGFPFANISCTPNTAGGMDVKCEDLAFFPNEGIFTRTATGQATDGSEIAFVETSSPGLRGQSGGPVFDEIGRVWGIQSSTRHISLGFDPPDPGAPGRTVHQFLNVGWSVHVSVLIRLMRDTGIKFEVA